VASPTLGAAGTAARWHGSGAAWTVSAPYRAVAPQLSSRQTSRGELPSVSSQLYRSDRYRLMHQLSSQHSRCHSGRRRSTLSWFLSQLSSRPARIPGRSRAGDRVQHLPCAAL